MEGENRGFDDDCHVSSADGRELREKVRVIVVENGVEELDQVGLDAKVRLLGGGITDVDDPMRKQRQYIWLMTPSDTKRRQQDVRGLRASEHQHRHVARTSVKYSIDE